MAYILNPEEDEEESQGSAAGGSIAPTVGGGGAGGAGVFGNTTAAAGSGAPHMAAPISSSSGTGWTNLQDYLNANSSQAAGMGQQVANNVGAQAQGAQNAINNLTQSFNGQVGKATTNYDAQDVNNDIGSALNMMAGGTYNPSDVANFQQYANASYNGPTNLSSNAYFTPAQNDLSNAENALNETQSEAGRGQLLHGVYGNDSSNGYNQGEQALDQGLIEGSRGAQQALGNVEKQWSGLSNQWNAANNNAGSEVANAKATDAATSQAAKDALGTYATYNPSTTPNGGGTISGGSGALGNWSSGLYGGLNSDESAYGQAQQGLSNSEASQQWTPGQLQAMGLNPSMNTYGVKLTGQDLQPGSAPTLASYASGDQYAQQQALNQLAGVLPGGPESAGSPVLNQTYASQAGTAAGVGNNPMYSLAKGPNGGSTFQNDVNAAQAGLLNTLQQNELSYERANGLNSNAPMITGFNPSTQAVTFGPPGGGNIATSLPLPAAASLNSHASNYLGGSSYAGSQANVNPMYWGTGNPEGFMSSPEMQAFENQINSTLANPNATSSALVGPTDPKYGGLMNAPARLAYGGFPTPGGKGLRPVDHLLNERLIPVPSEPRIPPMPKADSKLPALPKLSHGGLISPPRNQNAKFPVHTEEAARDSLDRVHQVGTPLEVQVVRRAVAARYPHLDTEPHFPGLSQALGKRISLKSVGGQVPQQPWKDIGGVLKEKGGEVPGKAKTPPGTNSYANDGISARLSPHEIVLPREVTQSSDPETAAAEFVRKTLKKKKT